MVEGRGKKMNLNIVVVFLLLVIIGLLLFPIPKNAVKPSPATKPVPTVTEKYQPVVVSTSGVFPYPDNVTNATEGT